MKLESALAGLMSLAAAGLVAPSFAQDAFPSRAVTMIVPFPPGGDSDTGACWITQELTERWGPSVIVDNKPGAAGVAGTDLAAPCQARRLPDPDGQRTGRRRQPNAAEEAAIQPGHGFHDAQPRRRVAAGAAGRPAVPASTTKEFIDLAKAKSGRLTYGSAGSGSSTHLAASLFEVATPTGSTPVRFQALIDSETTRCRKLIVDNGIMAH
jgi:tripartite-type tricarboxylate transporter receptor subunit TctC